MPAATAHDAWDELTDTLVDLGRPVDESETPRATADRLARLGGYRPDERQAVTLLGRAEEQARYAPRTAVATGAGAGSGARAGSGADELAAAVVTIRRLLVERSTRGERWRAVLLPRSVLAAMGEKWQSVSDRSGAGFRRVADSLPGQRA